MGNGTDDGERPPHVFSPLDGVEPGLGPGVADLGDKIHAYLVGREDPPGDPERLVEPAGTKPARIKGYRHDQTGNTLITPFKIFLDKGTDGPQGMSTTDILDPVNEFPDRSGKEEKGPRPVIMGR